jgi:hypothetical protein
VVIQFSTTSRSHAQTTMPALPFFAWAHRLDKNVRVFSLAAQEEIFSEVKVDG